MSLRSPSRRHVFLYQNFFLLQAMSRPDFLPPVFHLNPVKIELAPGHSKILELEGIVENPQIVRSVVFKNALKSSNYD